MDHDDVERRTGYYVTMRTGGKAGLLLGPYTEHADAQANVERVIRYAAMAYAHRGAAFWAYGTAQVIAEPGRSLPAGNLNAVLGLHEMTATARRR